MSGTRGDKPDQVRCKQKTTHRRASSLTGATEGDPAPRSCARAIIIRHTYNKEEECRSPDFRGKKQLSARHGGGGGEKQKSPRFFPASHNSLVAVFKWLVVNCILINASVYRLRKGKRRSYTLRNRRTRVQINMVEGIERYVIRSGEPSSTGDNVYLTVLL